MASTEEELALAKQAKAAIEGKLTTEAIEVPRKAYRMAAMQPAFASALRDARHNVGLALPPVTGGQPNQEEIEEVKSAIDAWIEALEGSL